MLHSTHDIHAIVLLGHREGHRAAHGVGLAIGVFLAPTVLPWETGGDSGESCCMLAMVARDVQKQWGICVPLCV